MRANQIEFTVIRDLYKEVELEDDEGNVYVDTVLVRKNFESPWMCRDIDGITDFEPAYNDQGRTYPKRTNVYYNNHMRTVKMSYNELKQTLAELEEGKSTKIGYGITNPERSQTGNKSKLLGNTSTKKDLGKR